MEDEDAFDEEIDALKFRLVLRPETDENNQVSVDAAPPAPGTATPGAASAASALPLHRLMIQTVGGRSCSQASSWSTNVHVFRVYEMAVSRSLCVVFVVCGLDDEVLV